MIATKMLCGRVSSAIRSSLDLFSFEAKGEYQQETGKILSNRTPLGNRRELR